MENHVMHIDGRERATITEVADVESFNDEIVLVSLKAGGLIIKGHRLHIQKLDIADGKVIITGDIISATYTEKRDKKDKGLIRKILK